jgi:hypothetical protein
MRARCVGLLSSISLALTACPLSFTPLGLGHTDGGRATDASPVTDARDVLPMQDVGPDAQSQDAESRTVEDAQGLDVQLSDAEGLDGKPMSAVDAQALDALAVADAGALDAPNLGSMDAQGLDAQLDGSADAGALEAGTLDATAADAFCTDACPECTTCSGGSCIAANQSATCDASFDCTQVIAGSVSYVNDAGIASVGCFAWASPVGGSCDRGFCTAGPSDCTSPLQLQSTPLQACGDRCEVATACTAGDSVAVFNPAAYCVRGGYSDRCADVCSCDAGTGCTTEYARCDISSTCTSWRPTSACGRFSCNSSNTACLTTCTTSADCFMNLPCIGNQCT